MKSQLRLIVHKHLHRLKTDSKHQTGCSICFRAKVITQFSLKFSHVKKINTTSRCVNHVYTLPPKLSSVINSDRVLFSAFWQFRATVKVNAKIQNAVWQVDPLRLAAQSTVKILAHGVHRNWWSLICGYSIIRKSMKLSHRHPEVNFESPGIIPQLRNNEGELFPLYISGLDGLNISSLFGMVFIYIWFSF